MSGTRASSRQAERVESRIHLLEEVAALGRDRLAPEVLARAAGTVEQAQARLGHGSAHTVVAIAGATGSGKSSLFNALVGETIADVGVRRPTTATAQAAVFGGGADRLLDWLEVPRRHSVASSDLDGLVLLDLPDHDSVRAAHRLEVDRLVQVVDTFLWVVDPQKYADAALHEQYLARFAAHGAVTVVVLNQIDTVPDAVDRRSMVDDMGRLLAADGLRGVRTMTASARTGEGLDALRRELAARVTERQAVLARLDADVDWLVDDLRVAVGDVTPGPVDRRARQQVEASFAFAAGVDALADAVGAAHRHRSVQQAGWPPVRWLRSVRPDPLKRLGLDRSAARSVPGTDAGPARTSRSAPTAVAEAAVDEALRTVAGDTGRGLPERWADRLHEVVVARRTDVADELDQAVAGVRLSTDAPRWWTVASAAQWLATGVMVVGLLWLLLISAVAWFGLPSLPAPDVGALELPGALALGGAAVGIVLAVLARWAARVGGRRRAASARRRLHRRVAEVTAELVTDPLDRELAALAELQVLARRLDS